MGIEPVARVMMSLPVKAISLLLQIFICVLDITRQYKALL